MICAFADILQYGLRKKFRRIISQCKIQNILYMFSMYVLVRAHMRVRVRVSVYVRVYVCLCVLTNFIIILCAHLVS